MPMLPPSPIALQGLKAAAPASQPSPQGGGSSGVKTPPGTPAAYMGPEEGPFQCSNCTYFANSGSCNNPSVIQELGPGQDGNAQVDAQGCCNLFESLSSGGDMTNLGNGGGPQQGGPAGGSSFPPGPQ